MQNQLAKQQREQALLKSEYLSQERPEKGAYAQLVERELGVDAVYEAIERLSNHRRMAA